jgi:hypothetical protein
VACMASGCSIKSWWCSCLGRHGLLKLHELCLAAAVEGCAGKVLQVGHTHKVKVVMGSVMVAVVVWAMAAVVG